MANRNVQVAAWGAAGIALAAAAIYASAPSPAPAPAPTPAPIALESRPAIGEGLVADGEANNLSGAACAPDGVCMLVGDEMRFARRFTLTAAGIVPDQGTPVWLLPDLGPSVKEPPETDAEGIAYFDGAFYVIGSHSLSKSGERQESRYNLYRVRLGAPGPSVDIAHLDAVIGASGALKDHRREIPGQGAHGVNIEGIAVAGDVTNVGFRGPVDAAGAVILTLPTASLFATPGPAQEHRVQLDGASSAADQGVRDLAAVHGGILILAGPEMRDPVPPNPELFFWDGKSRPISLGKLPEPKTKNDSPESITVLGETADSWRVLVLSDGKSGGDPMILRVARPKP